MALIISRDASNGSPNLLRTPFPEPGPQPSIRASCLAEQGVNNAEVSRIVSPENGGPLTPGTGMKPSYRVASSGVPGIRFTPSTDPNAENRVIPTLYNDQSNRTAAKALFTVFRVFSPANRIPTPGATIRDDFMHLVRATTAGNKSIYITGINDPGGYPAMMLRGTGGAASGHIDGPIIPANGSIHTAALVDRGVAGDLYVDGVFFGSATSNWVPFETTVHTLGFTCCGGDWDILEASQYETILTASDVREKNAHYEALYNFQN